MIYITQGHEDGIGIELFVKAFICLSKSEQKLLKLICFKPTLEKCLQELKITPSYKNNIVTIAGNDLQCHLIDDKITNSQSLSSLNYCLTIIEPQDILVTLPTTKTAIPKGHTEYLRSFYKKPDLVMAFYRNKSICLLLTDHIPLDKVFDNLSADSISNRVSLALNSIVNFMPKPKEVLIAGVNPHAGEDGILGNDKKIFSNQILKLSKSYPDILFKGPLSGDTLYIQKSKSDQILVYSFHDQALSSFKSINKYSGINITLGLPFLRLSPDFGTAFKLRNSYDANYIGLIELIKDAIKFHGN